MVNLHLTREPRILNGEKRVSSVNSSGKAGYLHAWFDHLPIVRHSGVWSQVGLRKHYYEQSYWRWWNPSWAITNLKRWCTQYASKLGKFSSDHRTGKGQFSFQSQRALPKNVQATGQLCSFHMLKRLCSKSFKLELNSAWIKNFQMYSLGLEKAEEPEIKLPTSTGSWRKQRNFRKICTSASLTMLKPLIVWITTNCGKFLEMGVLDHLICLLRNLYAGQEATVRTRQRTTDWFKIGKGVLQGCILSPCFFNLYSEHITWNAGLDESQARIKTAGRNINNLRYANGNTLMARKWRETKELLDKDERGEWKSWLKTQHSKN